ncbi:hypothetical protein OUZ56_017733 [Daphnia magna]|uniref:Uncharacterized protein n=1 Tax=Daphnia magna TaxID=35525 RepID=A0ABR0ATL5_9CRUS|nr:hypothetical protein OUZ56_017733 [Daphnia magna]
MGIWAGNFHRKDHYKYVRNETFSCTISKSSRLSVVGNCPLGHARAPFWSVDRGCDGKPTSSRGVRSGFVLMIYGP